MFTYHIDESVSLRLLQSQQAKALFELTNQNRDYLRRWLPWLDRTRSEADSEVFITSMLHSFSETGTFACGILYKGSLCGVIGYNRIDWTNKIAFPGYWLGQAFQGKGIMTTCCQVLIDHAFQDYRLNRVEITVATDNRKSHAIPERLGFTREGVIRDAEWLYDHYVDHTVHGLLKVEWKAGLTAERIL